MNLDAMESGQFVFLLDDDDAVRDGLCELLESVDLRTRQFAKASDFFAHCDSSSRGVLLLDLRMPEMGGLEVLERMRQAAISLPVIVVSAHGSIRLAMQAVRAGALDFVEKPFEDQELIDKVTRALSLDRKVGETQASLSTIKECFSKLTGRERDVFGLIVEGLANKEVAAKLGISPRTVENHRAQVMEKMKARGIADLVRMAARLGLIQVT